MRGRQFRFWGVVLVGAATLALVISGCAREPVETTQVGKVDQAVSGAVYTTVNKQVDKGNHCKNGNPPVNCNHYDGKEYVWVNGGPDSGGLKTNGYYFFAVLEPGGQPNPNDGGPKNLSDDFDPYTNRKFKVEDGKIVEYLGTHDYDQDPKRPTIRLFPYADTTNPGGVYIMAVCNLDNGYPVKPSDCKYDAFKVMKGPEVYTTILSGMKYRDDDRDGSFDEGVEVGLGGWTITIKGDNGVDTSVVTNPDGTWQWESDPFKASKTYTTYTICEVQQDHWTQTGNLTDQSLADSSVTVTLETNKCYTVVVDNDAPGWVSGLYFGNVPECDISGGKYYDGNKDGQLTAPETGIAGWLINQTGDVSASYLTVSDGSFSATLAPGSYTFAEVQAPGWEQTGNKTIQYATTGGATAALDINTMVYTVTCPVDQPATVTGLYFGNVCTVTPGGHTLGFWHNQNGQALITEEDLEILRGLHLRNYDGTDYDPLTKEDLATWLLGGNGVNMAYMLSVQLTATKLSALHGFTNTAVLVDGTMDVDALMLYADSLLAADGETLSGDPNRDEQTRVKGILDDINNGKSFVQPSPEYCPAPAF